MAEITASQVKELRECTGAGMMECKKALVESGGDMDQAVDILRTRGLAALAKKAGRATNEGAIAASTSADGTVAALVELNCETDFVARNAEFVTFAQTLADTVVSAAPADVTALMAAPYADRGLSVEAVLGEAVGKLGENMGVARFTRVEIAGSGAASTYIHGGGKIGVVVSFACKNTATASSDSFKSAARDIAMQVAAAMPLYSSRVEVPADVVAHEIEIYKAQAAESGKPDAIQLKIAEGRLEKYYKEVVLPEQVFVKDQDITVEQYLARISKEVGDEIEIVSFERWNLGETASAE
jgi:elongation factor Ts